jgi:hypothetical protein
LNNFESAPVGVISFIASHFDEIDRSFLVGLPISTLCRVLSQDSLQIRSEDWLYDFFISRFEVCKESVSLLAQIRFEYLSCDRISRFILWSFEHFESFCEEFPVWKAISVRLSFAVSPRVDDSRFLGRTFAPSCDGSLDGIIAHMTREHGGNVHDRGIVDISAKSVHSSSYLGRNAADLQSTTFFHSLNEQDQWLCYDFKNRRVRRTHYSIHAHSNNHYLRSWTLEGSVDGSSWFSLDEQKENSTTHSGHPIGTFSVVESAEYRFIRLRQTGKSAHGNDVLELYAFEIFGQLFESDESPSN